MSPGRLWGKPPYDVGVKTFSRVKFAEPIVIERFVRMQVEKGVASFLSNIVSFNQGEANGPISPYLCHE